MAKRNDETYTCSCGSSLFIQEGMANFKEEVTISTGKQGMVIEGDCPELDIIDATTRCAKCGAEI
jgi:hypothetical protein